MIILHEAIAGAIDHVRTFAAHGPVGHAAGLVAHDSDDDGLLDGNEDLNKNGVLDPYEDWRLSPSARAEAASWSASSKATNPRKSCASASRPAWRRWITAC